VKLLYVAPSAYLLGGVQDWLADLVAGQRRLGVEVTVAVPNDVIHLLEPYAARYPDLKAIPFTNPSGSAAEGIPYVVVVQSDLLDALATRLTMPLAVLDVATKVPTALCPIIMVKGQRLHALAHYAAPLPAKALRRPVENVASQASTLVSALDAVLSGI
jgi:toxin CcdB